MSLVYFVNEIHIPFVINDIKRIAAQTETIYLFSVDKLKGKEALPNNVIVFEEFMDWGNFKPLKIVLNNLFSILGIYINECIALKKILPLKKSFALLASNIFKAECVMNKMRIMPPYSLNTISLPLIAYSFWYYDCIYLAWLRKKGWIEKAITRAHGGDLFEERGSLSGKVLFRHFQGQYLDSILSVSQTGTEYLQHKYSQYKHKIQTIYLGSPNHEYVNQIKTNEMFVLVSCARIRNIKRIHKIAEMLQFVDFPITWIHLGDENLNARNDETIPIYVENKLKLNSKTNINFIAKGLISNDDIIKFYKENQVNLFISLSEAEGVPVSMMEAISFGIPILSTDVGGCSEIVTEKTGILINIETEMKEIAKIIKVFKDSSKNTIEFRKGVRQFWEKYFDAEKNYENIKEKIK